MVVLTGAGISAESGSGLDEGFPEHGVTVYGSPRKGNVRKDHVRSAENKILQLDMGENRNRIPNPAGVSNDRVAFNVVPLPKAANLSNDSARRDVGEVPDFGEFADDGPVINDGSWMNEGLCFDLKWLVHGIYTCLFRRMRVNPMWRRVRTIKTQMTLRPQ